LQLLTQLMVLDLSLALESTGSSKAARNGDDRNNHQQLYQGEAASTGGAP